MHRLGYRWADPSLHADVTWRMRVQGPEHLMTVVRPLGEGRICFLRPILLGPLKSNPPAWARKEFVLGTVWVPGRTGIMDVDPCSRTGTHIQKERFNAVLLSS